MNPSTSIGLSTEVRKLKAISPSHSLKLVQILDENDSWKFLMSIVPKVLEPDNFDYESNSLWQNKKYTADHVKLIENASKKDMRTASEIFLFEWAHSGRQRPTMGHLLSLLKLAQLFRAADYVAIHILGIDAPERPATGPAAKINILDLDAELSDEDADVANANENPQVSNATIENNLDNSKPQNTICRANAAKLLFSSPGGSQISLAASTAVIKTNVPAPPIVTITEATASVHIEESHPYLATTSKNGSSHSSSGVQAPPYSQSNSNDHTTSNNSSIQPNLYELLIARRDSSITGSDFSFRPNLSELLVVAHEQIPIATNDDDDDDDDKEDFMSSNSAKTISTISSTSFKSEVSPVPNLSELLTPGTRRTESIGSTTTATESDGKISASATLFSTSIGESEVSSSVTRPHLSELLNFGEISSRSESNSAYQHISTVTTTSTDTNVSVSTLPEVSLLLKSNENSHSDNVPPFSALLNAGIYPESSNSNNISGLKEE